MYNRFGGSYYRPGAPPAYATRGFAEHRAPMMSAPVPANPFRRSSAYAVLGPSSSANLMPSFATAEGVKTRSMDSPAIAKMQQMTGSGSGSGTGSVAGSVAGTGSGSATRDVGPTPGRVSDKYEMLNALGDGTFAKVWRCRQRQTGVEYAAKVIDLRRWRGNADVMRSIRREISILRSLDHACVVRLEEWYESRDEIVLVTDIVRGGDLLDRLLTTGALPESEARQVFKRVLEAVRYLHDRGIVHRDLKPENLLCVSSAGPDLKLCDFGQSARLSEREGAAGGSFGTFEYVAPEAIRRAPFDRPMDMWSCGVILFILLAGIFPFEGNGQDALFRAISAGRYRLPTRFERSLSREARDLIARLLTVSPSRRCTVGEALQHPWFAGC